MGKCSRTYVGMYRLIMGIGYERGGQKVRKGSSVIDNDNDNDNASSTMMERRDD